ncbi:hypothetical protein K3495_g10947 [Podosphaera aphanis]|nr:hypothetical protein K3495_g10947 [Podosphaera aphanis]
MAKAKQRLTVGQKLKFRDWYLKQGKKPSQAVCAIWLQSRFNVVASQSVISSLVHNKHLRDFDPHRDAGMSDFRLTPTDWPVLEEILRERLSRMESSGQSVSPDLIQDQARWIWHHMPEARKHRKDKDIIPIFGKTWSANFYKRWINSNHSKQRPIKQEDAEW